MEKYEVVPFEFNQKHIRTLCDEEGNFWFVAVDVARALGYKEATRALKEGLRRHHLDFTIKNLGGMLPTKFQTGSRGRPAWKLLSEEGFYCLVFMSKLPAAYPLRLVAAQLMKQHRKLQARARKIEEDFRQERLRIEYEYSDRLEMQLENERRP